MTGPGDVRAGTPARRFGSVLFLADEATPLREVEPGFFRDLNLDQVVEAMVAGREGYDLKPFFYTPASRAEVRYRQAVMGDLEVRSVLGHVTGFAATMRRMGEHVRRSAKLHYRYQQEAVFLQAAELYVKAVTDLARDLDSDPLRSEGMTGFRDYLTGYVASGPFRALVRETDQVRAGLSGVRYCLRMDGNRITVSRYDGEADYSAEVAQAFDRFAPIASAAEARPPASSSDMNHVETGVVTLVAQWFPEEFAALDGFCGRHVDLLDPTIGRFDREVQFYLAYLGFIAPLQAVGLPFCYPRVDGPRQVSLVHQSFDLALAASLVDEDMVAVCNDFTFTPAGRVLVVTGANQGGKTTFARMVGQVHHLARLGCPVPGRRGHVFLCDQIFTHFEREEDLHRLSGKLEDDLTRIKTILDEATGESLVVMNEIFTSTTVQDAIYLGSQVLARLIERGALGVCVTFVDELSRLDEATVSLVAGVDPDDPATRTFTVAPKAADGLAYAEAIAGKYGLTYPRLRERIGS
jgi:DNA mismatch repair protein MutS